ncbi:MAG: radical SAM protein [Steroidobacteraceae bacterium]
MCSTSKRIARCSIGFRSSTSKQLAGATCAACSCCMTGSNDLKKVRQSARSELTLEEIRDRIMIPARRLGINTMAWSGGEFLVRKDAMDLLRLTVEMDFRCSVLSNCKVLSRKRLEKIRDVTQGRARIVVGLNAVDDENRWSRDSESGRTIQVLRDCVGLGLGQHVVITIGKSTTPTASRRPSNSVSSTASRTTAHHWCRAGSGPAALPAWHSTGMTSNSTSIPRCANIHGYVSYTPYFLSPELHEQVSGGIRNNTVPQNPSIGCWVGSWLTINAEEMFPLPRAVGRAERRQCAGQAH